jgi:hypothetical protein
MSRGAAKPGAGSDSKLGDAEGAGSDSDSGSSEGDVMALLGSVGSGNGAAGASKQASLFEAIAEQQRLMEETKRSLPCS